MEPLVPVIVQVVTGIIGGLATGAVVRQAAMNRLPKIISGAVGGVAGARLLGAILGDPAAAGAMGGLLGDAAGGLCGGAILTGIVGVVMGAMNRR